MDQTMRKPILRMPRRTAVDPRRAEVDLTEPTPRSRDGRSHPGEIRGWRPPAPSKATRTWNPKSSASARALLVGPDDTLMGCESGLEMRNVIVRMGDPDVVALHEQADEVSYLDGDEEHRHTPDLVVELRNGRRRGELVKPDARACKTRRLVRLLEDQRPGDIDEWRHVGEAELSRVVVRRANLIGWVKRDGPASDAPEVVDVRRAIDRPMTIAAAIAASGTGAKGFRAIVRLITDGAVRTRGIAIDHDSTVEPTNTTNNKEAK